MVTKDGVNAFVRCLLVALGLKVLGYKLACRSRYRGWGVAFPLDSNTHINTGINNSISTRTYTCPLPRSLSLAHYDMVTIRVHYTLHGIST